MTDTSITNIVKVAWSIAGHSIPRDHGYLLWSTLAERVPALFQEVNWAVGPIRGAELGDRILLGEESTVRLRLPMADLGQALALSGADLRVGLDAVRLGAPTTAPLRPAKALRARVEALEAEIRSNLGMLPLEQEPWSIGVRIGALRVLRTRDRAVILREVTLSGLAPHASVVLQARGIGGRRHMGAGFFEPAELEAKHGGKTVHLVPMP